MSSKKSQQPAHRDTLPSRQPRRAQKPSGREEVREALLDAAQLLIAERGPAAVALRDIAEEAGVNFGLVYQYLGKREDILREVYQRVARRSAIRLEPIHDLDSAIEALMTAPDTTIGRIMAWAALEGEYPADVLGPSPALEHIAAIISGHAAKGAPTSPREEDRLMAAFVLVTALGWRLFQSIGLTSAGLDSRSDPERDMTVTAWLQALAASVSPR